MGFGLTAPRRPVVLVLLATAALIGTALAGPAVAGGSVAAPGVQSPAAGPLPASTVPAGAIDPAARPTSRGSERFLFLVQGATARVEVLSAARDGVEQFRVTINGVAPVARFADRPFRDSDRVRPAALVRNWDQWIAHAPNSVLSWSSTGGAPDSTVATLNRPTWDSASRSLTFVAVRDAGSHDVRDGTGAWRRPELPAVLSVVSLFIGDADPASARSLRRTSPQSLFAVQSSSASTSALRTRSGSVRLRLTMTGVDPVTQFSTGPYRAARALRAAALVSAWPSWFADSAPNAVLTFPGRAGRAPESVVVILSRPSYDPASRSLTFTAVVNGDGQPPSTANGVSLFIDDVNGVVNGCRYDWACNGISFAGWSLPGYNFDGATFVGSDFTKADFSGALFANTVGDGGDFRGVNFRNILLNYSSYKNADFRGADLTGAKLAFVDFTGADFQGATLDGVDLTGANLTNARLDASTVDGDLSGTIFNGATACSMSLDTDNWSYDQLNNQLDLNSCAPDWDDTKAELLHLGIEIGIEVLEALGESL